MGVLSEEVLVGREHVVRWRWAVAAAWGFRPRSGRERGRWLSRPTFIDRCLAGGEAAFDLLVRKYQREVYQLAYRITRNGEDARDLAQDAFVQAYRSLPSFQRKSSFYTWLYRITVNLCLNYRKGASRLDPAEVDERVPDVREDALDQLAREEFRKLPPEQRERVLRNQERWRNLPEEAKRNIRENLQRWRTLSPEQKAELRHRWQGMSQE